MSRQLNSLVVSIASSGFQQYGCGPSKLLLQNKYFWDQETRNFSKICQHFGADKKKLNFAPFKQALRRQNSHAAAQTPCHSKSKVDKTRFPGTLHRNFDNFVAINILNVRYFHNTTKIYTADMDLPLVKITHEVVDRLRLDFNNDVKNHVAMQACTRMDPLDVCLTRSGIEDISHVFNYKIDQEGKPVSNQKSSGRCWIFALFNNVRLAFMKHYNLDEFEFSQSHLFFYDKLERCNYFLNNVVETFIRQEKVDGRLMSFILQDPVCDGGQWDMLVNLVTRYGIMPKKNFPESFSSEATTRMNAMLRSKLREFCKELRDHLKCGTLESAKVVMERQLGEIYKIIGICLGIPREEFVWEYYDKSKVYHKVGPITPLDFYHKHVKPIFDIENKVCLINDPRPSNPYGRAYSVDLLGNMADGRRTIYNNQPIDLLIKLAAESIKLGEPVWFGCEVTKRFAAKQGIEDLKIHDYVSVFGTDVTLGMTKADRLLYGEAAMTHAMLFTAVSIDDDGNPTKWRVENSWGDDRGEKGYLLMTTDWFREFVFEVVVDKSVVPDEVLKVFSSEPTVLPAWDPMGALACKNCHNFNNSES